MNALVNGLLSVDPASNPVYTRRAILAAVVGVTLVGGTARAELAPYAVDANTLHLWHLDDSSAPVQDSGVAPLALNGLLNGATLNNPSLAGFGTALRTAGGSGTNLPILLGASALANNAGDDVPFTFAGANGAFTYETLFKFDAAFDPAVAGVARNMEFLSLENDGTFDRGFQFRFEAKTATAPARLNFTSLRDQDNSTANGLQVQVRTIDIADGFLNNADFFHVAAAYTGAENVANNLTFFLTKVTADATQASVLGTSTLARDLSGVAGDFAIGNEARTNGGETEPFQGLLDEVRVSDIARSATGFGFIPAGTRFWNTPGSGNWDVAANWTTNTVPDAVSAAASFGGGGTPIVGPATVTLDGARTVGFLTFDDAANGFTLVSGGGGSLVLDNGASAAVVNVKAGQHGITVPVAIAAGGATLAVASPADVLIVTGNLSGGALTKTGGGTLVVSGNATHAGTVVNGGVLQVGNGAAAGSLGGGDITLAAGRLSYFKSGNVTLANNIGGVAGSLAQDGNGVLTLTGNNTFGTGGGGVVANAGTIRLGNATALASGAGVELAGGKLDLNAFDAGGGLYGGTAGTVTDDSAGPGTTQFRIGGTGATDASGTIRDGATRTLSVAKTGTSLVRLRGANPYSGGTTLTQGFLDLYANDALGSGPVVMNPDVVVPGGASSARLTLADGVTLANPITMSTANAGVATGSIQALDNATATLSGPIQIDGNAITGGHFAGPATSGFLNMSGPITTGGSLTSVLVRFGRTRFGGGGNYPAIELRAGLTEIAAPNGLATTAIVDLAGNGSPTVATTLDLAGQNQTLAGLRNAVGVNNAALVTNAGATPATLTFANGSTGGVNNVVSYGGSIDGNLRVRATSGTQILGKLGTSTLNGNYAYTGATVVDGGTLQLGSTAWNPTLAGAGADVNAGRLVFDYAGTTSPLDAQVYPLLDASHATGFTGGQFRSATASASRGIGYFDDGASLLTLANTFYGDADLNLNVGFADLVVLAQNYNGPGTLRWQQGDFNYDGAVGFADLVALAQNYGASVTADGSVAIDASVAGRFAADWALAQGLVPEPVSLALLGLGAAVLRRRR